MAVARETLRRITAEWAGDGFTGCAQQVMHGPDWAACYVSVFVIGETLEAAQRGVREITDAYAKGKEAVFRFRPEAESMTDFAHNTIEYKGYARFHFFDREGEWRDADVRDSADYVIFRTVA